MGRLNFGIFSGFTGRVGNVVGSRWRGMDIIRKRPARRSSDAASDAQLRQREKFAFAMQFLNPIQDIFNVYFGLPSGSKSRFNLATGHTLRYAIIEDPLGNLVFDYSKIQISRGKRRGVDNGTATSVVAETVALDWNDNSLQSNAASDDWLLVVAYCPELQEFVVDEQAAIRGDQNVKLSVPSEFSGKEVHIWAGFYSEARKRASLSSYFGMVTVM